MQTTSVVLVTMTDPEAGVAAGADAGGGNSCPRACRSCPAARRSTAGRESSTPIAMAQLIIKTRAAVWPTLRNRIVELRDDEVPEILALPVSDGLPAYLRWVDEMTTAEARRSPDSPRRWSDRRPRRGSITPTCTRGQHTVSGTMKSCAGWQARSSGNHRDILVYLPPSYDAQDAQDAQARRYPVLYMHDGQNLFDAATSYAGEWHVDETMETLARQGSKQSSLRSQHR